MKIKGLFGKGETKVKKTGDRRWWIAGIGVLALALAFYFMTLYSQDRNNFIVAMASILALAGGGAGIYFGLKKQSVGIILAPGLKSIKEANCLNIYPDRIEFDKLVDKELLGQPQRCHNDNKYYYVHILDEETEKLKVFILPDTQYRDPREFANNLNIPATRELMKGEATLIQKIAPFALVVGMLIVCFMFLVIP